MQIFYKNEDNREVTSQIKDTDGRPVNLTGSTIRFSMRFSDSSALKIDSEEGSITTNTFATYVLTSDETDEIGTFKGWFTIDTGSDVYDTEEFDIIISEHSPGRTVQTGKIYQFCNATMPISWKALEASPKYGESFLQSKIEIEKLRVLPTVVDAEDESTLDIRVVDYLAKRVCLELIPTAKDYWLDQKVIVSNTGTAETVSYPDRLASLESLQKDLTLQVAGLDYEIGTIVDSPVTVADIGTPAFSDGTDVGFVTPLPSQNFPDYAFPHNDGCYRRRATRNYSW